MTGVAVLVLTVVLAVAQVVKGLAMIPVLIVGVGAAVCAVAAGRLHGRRRQVAGASFIALAVVLVVLLAVLTRASDSEAADRSAERTPVQTTPQPSAPSTPSATPRTPPEPAEKPKSYIIREGGSQEVFDGGLVVGLSGVSSFGSLTLSTRGPQCTATLEPGEKALISDSERNWWYEVRLTELAAKQVTISVARGIGQRGTDNCLTTY